MSRRYILISPCRNEAAYLQTTIDAVAAQTVPPTRWVIVDDGSTDETPEILRRAAATHEFISVVTREDRGTRAVGPGVIQAFNEGLASVDLADFDYLCKLDVDLDFGPRYFERVMERFEADPWLGNFSGKLFLQYGDKLVEERCGDENAVGPAKFYRRECFEGIGGFMPRVSWDGIDGHTCRMKGWVALSEDEEECRIIHLRRMGSSQQSFWTGRTRWGRGKYFMGSTPMYVCAVSIYRMVERPFILSGIGISWGYLRAWLSRAERYDDPDYLRFFRQFERRCLFRGKRRTTDMYHDRVRREWPDRVTAGSSGAEGTTAQSLSPSVP